LCARVSVMLACLPCSHPPHTHVHACMPTGLCVFPCMRVDLGVFTEACLWAFPHDSTCAHRLHSSAVCSTPPWHSVTKTSACTHRGTGRTTGRTLDLHNGTCDSVIHVFGRQRLWGSLNMAQWLLTDVNCWLEHLALDPDTGLDPPGIKLRAVTGLSGLDYFVQGYAVWARLIQALADLGYDSNNLVCQLTTLLRCPHVQTLSRVFKNCRWAEIWLSVGQLGGFLTWRMLQKLSLFSAFSPRQHAWSVSVDVQWAACCFCTHVVPA
jgi:hypothetical protein